MDVCKLMFSRTGTCDGDSQLVKVLHSRRVYDRYGIQADILELSDGSWAVSDTRGKSVRTAYFSDRRTAEKYCKGRGLYQV